MTEYRIDDLARASGMTVRNIRVYQDRGLLAPPRRVGRVGWYDELHLARLRLIKRLLDRGYTFAQIKELQGAWEQGRDIGDVLGLEDAITRPWSDEEPERVSLADLRKLFGKQATPAAIQRATALGLIRREGAHYVAPSLRLLQAGSALIAEGVPLVTVLDLAEALSADMDASAKRFITMVREHLLPLGDDGIPLLEGAEAAAMVGRLRPLVRDTVEAVLAIAMERQVSAELGEVMGKITRNHQTRARQARQAELSAADGPAARSHPASTEAPTGRRSDRRR
ncbi:MAG TPA: MerR family transcriptional regulator [Mycobacteriales bacterium]|nr:MerR family transcriptional regulator [Mycobacteriales bacterium]